MTRSTIIPALCCLLGATPAWSQGPEPPALSQRAARRFPQPVRVGDLTGRQVLEPSNHQHVLGRVDHVARITDGRLLLIVRYGGVLGLGTRLVAIPIDSAALLGQFVQIVDGLADQIATLPSFDGLDATSLAPDDIIHVGINRN